VLPKIGEFVKVLDQEAGQDIEVMYPSIIAGSILDAPINPSGDSKTIGNNALGAEAIHRSIIPKSRFVAKADGDSC
jgi:hypothetical protein